MKGESRVTLHAVEQQRCRVKCPRTPRRAVRAASVGTASVRAATVGKTAGRVVAAPPERVDEARVGVDVVLVEAQNLIDLGLSYCWSLSMPAL